MPFIRERSITSPSSQTALPATLWPPPRTATSRLFARAKFTHEITSPTPAQRATKAGRLSTEPFQTLRASSYPASPRQTVGPRRDVLNSSIADGEIMCGLLPDVIVGTHSTPPGSIISEKMRLSDTAVKSHPLGWIGPCCRLRADLSRAFGSNPLGRITAFSSTWNPPRKRTRQIRHNCGLLDRKSTRLNSSHRTISYAVFCLKKKIFRMAM